MEHRVAWVSTYLEYFDSMVQSDDQNLGRELLVSERGQGQAFVGIEAAGFTKELLWVAVVWCLLFSEGCIPKNASIAPQAALSKEPPLDQSSPERLLDVLHAALARDDRGAIVRLCDPVLRPGFQEFVVWNKKLREANKGTPLDDDLLVSMTVLLEHRDERILDHVHAGVVKIRNKARPGAILLRERGGLWYFGLYEEAEAEAYMMRLLTEVTKLHLSAKSGTSSDQP
ncbi:MAG: hypothetical protein WCK05_16400, partial [Planctomycetota bacterium]